MLEVNRGRWTARVQQIIRGALRISPVGTLNTKDVGSEVRQDHAAERARTDAPELENAYAG
jgi:hypothetical protein